MAIEKVYKCDLCGEFVHKDDVRRVGVRLVEDRSDGADWLEIGPECRDRPIGDLLDKAAASAPETDRRQRLGVSDGE